MVETVATDRLRLAVATAEATIPAWARTSIENVLGLDFVDLVMAISVERRHWREPFGDRLARLYHNLWLKFRVPALRSIDCRALLKGVQWQPYRVFRDAAGLDHIDEADLRQIRASAIDVLLDFSGGHFAATPTAARLGVWLHDCDLGRPDHVRSLLVRLLKRRLVLHARLLRYGDPAGNVVVLCEGFFRVQVNLRRTLGDMLAGVGDWCARGCRAAQLGAVSSATAVVELVEPRRVTSGAVLRYLVDAIGRRARAVGRRLLLLETWNIAVVDQPISEILRTGQAAPARWLAAPSRTRFNADPFAVRVGGQLCFIFEEFDYGRAKGRISTMTLMPTIGATAPRPVLTAAAHASYPFLVAEGDKLYCVPEMAETGKVLLYRAVDFPYRWELDAVLIDDFPALDSTLFLYQGRWWLFCTSAKRGGEHQLYAWHSTFLHGPWQPHALNPLKCDPRSTRPAGTPFMIDGVLYRPAQDCARTYGGAVVLNRVGSLSPIDFAEEIAGRISPDPTGPYPAGLHTVCAVEDLTVIDGKRFIVSPSAFPLWVWNRWQGRRRRMAVDQQLRAAE
jgi:hypothetical protein